MIQRSPTSTRAGFSLLEVLLSSAISVLLFGALYVAVEIQLRRTQAARDLVERSTLARTLMSRMASDINPSLAPTPPPPQNSSGGGGGGGNTNSGNTGTGNTNSGNTGTGNTGNTGSGASGAGTSGASARERNRLRIRRARGANC